MNLEHLARLGQVAGIAGIALGVLAQVFRDILAKSIFPQLSVKQSYRLLRLIIVLTWSVAILGILAWAWARTQGGAESESAEDSSFQVAGMRVECDLPLEAMIGERNLQVFAETHTDSKTGGYFLVLGYLTQKVLTDGETLRRYECQFDDPRFYAEIQAAGPKEMIDGRTCRSYLSTTSPYWEDDELIVADDSLSHVRYQACLNDSELWEPVRADILGKSDRNRNAP